ncbi:UbiX family flavin prenyltransferase [bacterium]|nr:UbiX family flavin prenyltransferase [bacterium]
MKEKRWTIALTGASGTIYARKLVKILIEHDPATMLDLVISDGALRVLREEDNISTSHGLGSSAEKVSEELFGLTSARIVFHNPRDTGAAIASGSYPSSGMVIVPCSMSTLGCIANGVVMHLVHRAAEVTLKENRKLIVVPRETPLTSINLENMLKLRQAGAVIMPAMPGFYQQPTSIDDLAEYFAMRITDQLGYNFDFKPRWGQASAQTAKNGF